MGEALITRRGGGGGIKTGLTKNESSANNTLKISALVGVKNAIITAKTKTNADYHTSMSALIIELRNGKIYKALVANSSGKAMLKTSYVTFDSATGTFTSSSTSNIKFVFTTIDDCYEYIIFD